MGKVLETLKRNFKYYFLHFLLIPVLAALAVYAAMLIVKYKKSHSEKTFADFMKSNIFAKENILTLPFVSYLFILYHATVTNRVITQQHFEPLSNIFGGWTVIEHQYFYDMSAIWNVVMFLPMAFAISKYAQYSKGIKFTYSKLILLSASASFLFSLLIEISQIIFRCGTFQLSDLFYNTLGGLIGALIYCAAVKIVNKKRC